MRVFDMKVFDFNFDVFRFTLEKQEDFHGWFLSLAVLELQVSDKKSRALFEFTYNQNKTGKPRWSMDVLYLKVKEYKLWS